MFVIFALSTAGLLIGILLIWNGSRGKVVDDHPCCGQCGFDLVALAPGATCPECGSLPGRKRRLGNRKRHPRRLVSGIAITVLTSVILTTIGVLSIDNVERFAPLWLLRMNARRGSHDAATEIATRFKTGTLNRSNAVELIDEALEFRHRSTAWRDLVEAARATGQLSRQQEYRYVEECVTVRWAGRSELYLRGNGQPSGVELGFTFVCSATRTSNISFEPHIESAQVDGAPVPIAGMRTGERSTPFPVAITILLDLKSPVAGKTLVVRWRVKIVDAQSGTSVASDWVHTETIVIPASGNGILGGNRTRVINQANAAAPTR